MGKYKELVEDHLNARIAKHKVGSNVLGVLKGEVETISKGSSEDLNTIVESVAKKMHKNLETIGTDEAQIEMEILEPYLPVTMTKEQIIEELSELGIENLPSFGAKMGRAIGILGKKADGKLIKQVIEEHYS